MNKKIDFETLPIMEKEYKIIFEKYTFWIKVASVTYGLVLDIDLDHMLL